MVSSNPATPCPGRRRFAGFMSLKEVVDDRKAGTGGRGLSCRVTTWLVVQERKCLGGQAVSLTPAEPWPQRWPVGSGCLPLP